MTFDSIIQNLIKKRPSFKKAYLQHDVYMEVSNLITAARLRDGLSQKELAQLVKTQQPSIARLEGGKFLPNVGFLDKIAKALNTYLIIKFGFMNETDTITQSVAQETTMHENAIGMMSTKSADKLTNLTIDDLLDKQVLKK